MRLAWVHIREYGVDKAVENVCGQIQRFAASVGAPDKYNRTVTEAAVRALYHFYLKSPQADIQELLQKYPRLKTQFLDLLKAHYSFDIFHTPEAKRGFLQPDLLPFD